MVLIIKRGKCSRCGWVCCQRCPHLEESGLCKIYSERPEGCRVYPHNPMALEKDCTFWFEEDGVKITAENIETFSEDKRRGWLKVFVDRSIDE